MTGQFAGWPEQAFDLLLRLGGEPTMAERDELRDDRERLVRQPMVELCQELADADPAYEQFHVWHLHRNPWLWQHQYAGITLGRRVDFGLVFDLDGLLVEGGWPRADPGQVDRFRAAVADETSGSALVDLVARLRAAGFTITGDQLKRPPHGCTPLRSSPSHRLFRPPASTRGLVDRTHRQPTGPARIAHGEARPSRSARSATPGPSLVDNGFIGGKLRNCLERALY